MVTKVCADKVKYDTYYDRVKCGCRYISLIHLSQAENLSIPLVQSMLRSGEIKRVTIRKTTTWEIV